MKTSTASTRRSKATSSGTRGWEKDKAPSPADQRGLVSYTPPGQSLLGCPQSLGPQLPAALRHALYRLIGHWPRDLEMVEGVLRKHF